MTFLAASIPPPVLGGIWEWLQRADDGSITLGWVVGKILLVLAALTVWAERRVSAWMQDRLGPNRVGPQGLLQPLADLGKFIFKEDMLPGHVNRWMYLVAPVMSLVPALVTFAVIPFTGESGVSWQIADINIGVLYLLAITSLGVYGITLGGWASNSKYPLLGGVRSSAQMISYELSMGLGVVAVVLLTGWHSAEGSAASPLHLGQIVSVQSETTWFAFQQPLAFFIFLVASYAETNRLPFDLPEAEQEIVAGYHTEYSAMKFAAFFLAEYINMVVASALVVTLFCGGWTLFGLEQAGWIVGLLIFAAKVFAFIFLFLWIRWTLPRFRYDQLMRLGWAWFLPLALVNVLLIAAGLALEQPWMVWGLPLVVALVSVSVFMGRRPAEEVS